jgi:hypothetical protein
VQGREVERAQLLECLPEPPGDARGSERVGVRGVRLVERHIVVGADGAERALALAEAVELLVEHVGVDDEHAGGASDALEQRRDAVAARLAVEAGEVEARVERDDGDAGEQLLGEQRDDLLDRLARLPSLRAGALGRDAVDGGGAGGDLDPRVAQPRVEDRRPAVADDAHGGRDDAVRLAVDSRRLQVKCGEATLVPAHAAEG